MYFIDFLSFFFWIEFEKIFSFLDLFFFFVFVLFDCCVACSMFSSSLVLVKNVYEELNCYFKRDKMTEKFFLKYNQTYALLGESNWHIHMHTHPRTHVRSYTKRFCLSLLHCRWKSIWEMSDGVDCIFS